MKKKNFTKLIYNDTFENRLMRIGQLPNLASVVIMLIYTFFFSGVSASIHTSDGPKVLIAIVAIIVFLQFIVAPNTNHAITQQLSKELNQEKKSQQSLEERSLLLDKLYSCPSKKFVEAFILFLIGILILICLYIFLFRLSIHILPFLIIASLFCCYIAALVAYTYTENVCSYYAKPIIQKGVNHILSQSKTTHTTSIYKRAFLYIVVPVVWEHLLTIVYIIREKRICIEFVSCNIVLTVVLTAIVFQQIFRTTIQINSILEGLSIEKIKTAIYIPTDISNELNYNVALINTLLAKLQTVVEQTSSSTTNLQDAINQLSLTAKNTAETSITQSSSVKECLATMNSIQDLLANISATTADVEQTTKATRNNINEGFSVLKNDIIDKQMIEISNANLETITGIKTLSEKVDKVWEIITAIDAIAERTKIIAFNAELKAAGAGDNGENFHVIANEIRRLAATITSSIHDIKDRIKNIQEASDNLIVTSESGTQKIREISKFFSDQEETFSELYTTSDITVESAEAVKIITDAQEQTFAQINSSLQQISIGFDQFLSSTQLITTTAQNLQNAASQLTVQIKGTEEASYAE